MNWQLDLSSDKYDRNKNSSNGMAEWLKDHIYAMGWAKKTQARWNKAFALLIEQHGEEAVWSRLKQYCALKITRPKIQNGDEFRNNWDWIGEEIERRRLTEVEVKDLTKNEQAIVESVTNIGWPTETHAQIPGVVRRSLYNLKVFKTNLTGVEDKRLKPAFLELVPYLIAEECLVQHFLEVHRKYSNWDQWSGDLTAHVWSPTHEIVQRAMKAVLVRWAGEDDGSWDKLLKVTQ